MDPVQAYLETELRKSETELDALKRQDEGVHTRMSQLEATVTALRLLIAKRAPRKASLLPVDEWTILPRTEAVLRILQGSDGPLRPREISKQLIARGRSADTPNAVSGALSRLKTTGRVQPYGHNRWIAGGGTAPEPANGQVEAGDRLNA